MNLSVLFTNQWSHIWAVNEKIFLRQSDRYKVFEFTGNDQFDKFLQDSENRNVK